MKASDLKFIAACILGCIAFIAIICEPSNEENWLQIVLISKGIGAACAYACYKLFIIWYTETES